jgi:hypothetical protein
MSASSFRATKMWFTGGAKKGGEERITVQGNQIHFAVEKRTGIWKIEDGKLWLCVVKEGVPESFVADRPGTKLMVLKRTP